MEKGRSWGELDYELPHLDAAFAGYRNAAAAAPSFEEEPARASEAIPKPARK